MLPLSLLWLPFTIQNRSIFLSVKDDFVSRDGVSLRAGDSLNTKSGESQMSTCGGCQISRFFFSFPAIVKWDSNRLIPYTTCWILFIAVPDWISKKNCWTILVLPDINIASIIRKPHLARRTKPLTVLTWKHPPVHPPLNEPCICLCTLHQYPQFPPSLVHRLVITCSQFLSLSLFRLHITYIFAYRLTFCLPSCANIYIPHKLCLVNISSIIPASSPTHPSFYILGFSFWSLCVVFSCMPFRVPFVSWIRSFFSICVSPACFSHSLRFPIILLSCVFHIWKT